MFSIHVPLCPLTFYRREILSRRIFRIGLADSLKSGNWRIPERGLDEIVEQLIMCISQGDTVGIFPVKYFRLLHARQELECEQSADFGGSKFKERRL